jgi:hypothetical protein
MIRAVPGLTEHEWMAVADALHDLPRDVSDHGVASALCALIIDADATAAVGAKWGVNVRSVVARLQSTPFGELLALVLIVRELWKDPGGDWPALLRARGVHFTGAMQPTLFATGASLTDEQISTLMDLIRTGNRDDYDVLCGALGSRTARRCGPEPVGGSSGRNA